MFMSQRTVPIIKKDWGGSLLFEIFSVPLLHGIVNGNMNLSDFDTTF